MDKETLSNYGWIVICVLVLAVMIALATPFGTFVSEAVQSTTKGLFDVNKSALDAAGIIVDDNDFETEPNNVLEGKTLAIFGTSISITGDKYVTTSYNEALAEKHNMILKNYAVSGATAPNILNQYQSNQKALLPQLTEDDYIIFEGFLNDWDMKVLGEVTPVGTTAFDTSTTLGAIETFIYEYQNSGCKAKMGVILTHFATRSNIQNQTIRWDAIISICQKYNVPYLDLRNKEYELQSDKVHITQESQLLMADDVEVWLKTLK